MTLNNTNRLIGNLSIKTKSLHQLFDREVKASRHIPITHFVTPEIFSTKNGELGAVIKLSGVPFNVMNAEELNYAQRNFAFAMQNLGDEYAIYQTMHRHLQSNDLEGRYPSGFSKDFIGAYSERFRSSKLFVNDLYITLIRKSSNKEVKKGAGLLHALWIKKTNESLIPIHSERVRDLESVLTHFISTLLPYSPSLLGKKEYEKEGTPVAEVLGFLSILVNGYGRDFTYPYQNIATFVPEKRLFFGKNTIHFQGLHEGDDRFGALLSVKAYSPTTKPGMLNELLTVPFESISTHSFSGINKSNALNLIEKQINRMRSTEDAALSQIADLETAKDDLASGRINFGFHHNTILVLGDTAHDLEKNVAKINKIYQDQRLVVVRESMNLENAFLAQIPGNARYIRRSVPVSSNNFTSFCSLHNYYSGYINGNHLGSALMLIETPSNTPFFLNLHEKASGSKNDLPKGHTLSIGMSNAGKTVIMLAIDAAFKKYGIRSIIFDRNRGCEIYVRAMRGIYNRLIPGESTNWNVCQLQDTSKNKKFLRDFITVLSTSAASPLTASDHRSIADVVERNYTLPFEKRNLSNISSFFPLNFSGHDALSRYLRLADRTGKSGDLAYLFDNEEDQFNLNADTIGFDMTHWLSDTGGTPEELLPISMYLFHRLEESFDGRLTGIYLEEGWQFLQQDYWKEKIEEYLVTLRKYNVFLYLSTQLPDKLAKSKIASALIQGSATTIFLANPKASEQDYIESFKLSQREYEIIKNFDIQSRYFLVKQGHEAAVGRINLQGFDNYLSVFSGNIKSVELCERICAEHGNDPEIWLPHFYERVRR